MDVQVAAPASLSRQALTDPSSDGQEQERFDDDRPLRTLDVACLIINKMIGGGIFVSPRIVAHLTGNKLIALSLWVFGGVYSFCSIYIYLEYGLAWPYNGGEFIYISKVFPVPPLLFASAFAWVFVAFATSTTNSITFARYINPDNAEDPDVWFTKFFACVIVVGICAVHHRFLTIGIAANNILAAYKVLFLGVLVIAGLVETIRQGAFGHLLGLDDYTTTHGNPSATNIILAVLQVLYSYQGWENANYVTSEIRGGAKGQRRRLKRGALIAISVVVTLYISFNMFVFFILDFDAITDPAHNVAADYAITVFRSKSLTTTTHAIYVSIALAAAGNIIGVTFSNARVNRDIARHRLIPLSTFFSKSSQYGKSQWDNLGTPTGGLILQALVTCVTIASIQPFTTVLTLYTYGHAVVCSILGIGVFFIRKRMNQYDTRAADPRRPGHDQNAAQQQGPWGYQVLKRRRYRYTAAVFFIIVNGLLVVVPHIPSDNPDGSHRGTPSHVQPAIVMALYATGALVAVYIIAVARGLRFRGSTYHRRLRAVDLREFVNYNERRWIVVYPWEAEAVPWRGVLAILPWKDIWSRLWDNGEAREARRLNALGEEALSEVSQLTR